MPILREPNAFQTEVRYAALSSSTHRKGERERERKKIPKTNAKETMGICIVQIQKEKGFDTQQIRQLNTSFACIANNQGVDGCE